MKACKGLLLFCFLGFSVTSCFDPPEFTNTPSITVNKVIFKEVPGPGTPDSLILVLNFKDGDGDLGLDREMVDAPYNESFYFLADGTGETIPISTTVIYSTDGSTSYFVIRRGTSSGKLVTDRTRTLPNYGHLPVYDPNSCFNYLETDVLVGIEDASIIDASYNITDTLVIDGHTYYQVSEVLLYEDNPNNKNIDVQFFVFDGGDYEEFDWFAEFCQPDFDGRFPLIPHRIGEPIEGTLRYAMTNSSFLAIFSVDKVKLRVKIRDRALNVSNVVETAPFQFLDICTNCN